MDEIGKKEWYEMVSLDDAKNIIKSNLVTAARSFIAIGYYLKHIRDHELFLEDNYETIWDLAKGEFGISKSTASRYMSMNDRFSQNGNSPLIQEQYKEFGKSQLQEMLSLTDQQIEQVTPDITVQKLREMRGPKEIPYFEIEGQLDLLDDFPETVPGEVQELAGPQKQTFVMDIVDLLPDEENVQPIATSQQEEKYTLHFTDGDLSIDNAYGTMIAEIVKAYLDGGYVSLEKECEVTSYGRTCKVLKRPEVTAFYTEAGETFFDVENSRLEKEYQYWHGDKKDAVIKQQKEELSPVERGCITGLSPYSNCVCCGSDGAKCCGQCDKECNGRCGWVTKPEAEEPAPKEIEEENEADGPWKEEALPDESWDLGVCSYPRFATQARKALDRWVEEQTPLEDTEKPQTEKVIDAEFSEIQPTPVTYDKAILEEMIRQEEQMLEHMGDTWKKKQPYYYTKHTMTLEAYRMLQAANEGDKA